MTKSTITISVTDAEGHDITGQFDLVAAPFEPVDFGDSDGVVERVYAPPMVEVPKA